MFLVYGWYSSYKMTSKKKEITYKMQDFSKQVTQLEQNISEESTSDMLDLASQIEEFGDKHINIQAYALAGRLYETLSKKGNGRASYEQFQLLKDKLKKSDSIYIPYLKAAAEQGFPRGQYDLALYYYKNNKKKESYDWLKKAEDSDWVWRDVLIFLKESSYLKDISTQVKLTPKHRKLLNQIINQEAQRKNEALYSKTKDRELFPLHRWLGKTSREVKAYFGVEDPTYLSNNYYHGNCLRYANTLSFCLNEKKIVISVHSRTALQSNPRNGELLEEPDINTVLPASFHQLKPQDTGDSLIYSIGNEKWEFKYHYLYRTTLSDDPESDNWEREMYQAVVAISIYKSK